MHVIGTAGHVDHGKSTLVEALTGSNPDRLLEEQKREMTIELGFAWMTLSNNDAVGIVDVPGHRDFIENMLAGVGGIDAVLFVVAADEGIMPQTREHLAIIDLLQIPQGIVVLTKIDLVEGEEWIELVKHDLHPFLSGTVLENAPILAVSAKKGIGMDALKMAIEQAVGQVPPRKISGKPRLPIDRVFTISGFGTVVTGTLLDGQLTQGEEIQIYPGGLFGKIRGLQTHKKKENVAVPGSRTAVNISGLEAGLIKRGDVLGYPGQFKATRLLDVQIRLLKGTSRPLSHISEIKLFIGAAEILGRVRVLGTEKINAGEEGLAQLELASPTISAKGDRFILRIPSPGETIGGGLVIEPHPEQRHKRFDEAVINRLRNSLLNNPEDDILNYCEKQGILSIKELLKYFNNDQNDWEKVIQSLMEQGRLHIISQEENHDENLVITQNKLQVFFKDLTEMISNYHQQFPLRAGMPKEEVKSRFKEPTRLVNLMLRQMLNLGLIKENKMSFALPGYEIHLNPKQQSMVAFWLNRFKENPFTPPGIKEIQAEMGKDLYHTLIDQGILIELSDEVVFRKEDFQAMRQIVGDYLTDHESISVAQFRDLIQTSRKYALAFLEYLDSIGVTTRNGDFRRLNRN